MAKSLKKSSKHTDDNPSMSVDEIARRFLNTKPQPKQIKQSGLKRKKHDSR